MSTTEAQPLPALQEKFLNLEIALNAELVERGPAIRALITALISGQHVFFLGAPGIAKSYLVNRIEKYIEGARRFDILLTRFSTPEEVIGPKSLMALKQDRDERNIDGYLPTADLAFIDEIFKANSSILNSLLQAINERVYRHGTQVIDIPLSTMFCASNELPQDDSLNALYDRLLMRLEIRDIVDHGAFVEMLKTNPDEEPTPILTWSEVQKAREEALEVTLPDALLEGVADIRRKLHMEGIHPTPRRFRQSLSVVRAAAWMDGEATAELEHLRPLQHILWDHPEQFDKVASIVATVASPLDVEALQLLDEITIFRRQLEALQEKSEKQTISTPEMNKAVMKELETAKRMVKSFFALRDRASKRRRQSDPVIQLKKQCLWVYAFFIDAFDLEEIPGMSGLDG